MEQTASSGTEHVQIRDAFIENMDFTESQHEENMPEPSLSNENRLERSAAFFLISLKERYEITQSALDFAVFQVQQMVAYAVKDIKE